VKTPNFDRVAKEGLLFLNAYTPTAKCTPSRSTILTGRHPWLLGAAANHQCVFPPEHAIFPDALEQHGYAYASTGKVWAPGLALKADGSPRAMAGKQFNQKKTKAPTTGISNNDYSGNFESFLTQAKPGQPWFFWLGSVEPHRDYEEGSGARLGGKKTSDIDHVPAYWPDNETIRGDMLDYAYEVEYFDRHVGRALAMLEKTGQLENTIVVVTSDNGMPLRKRQPPTARDPLAQGYQEPWPQGHRLRQLRRLRPDLPRGRRHRLASHRRPRADLGTQPERHLPKRRRWTLQPGPRPHAHRPRTQRPRSSR
jgi:arylsulfatase A-like enzyme